MNLNLLIFLITFVVIIHSIVLIFNVKVDTLENGDLVLWYSFNKKRHFVILMRHTDL